jgi:hypothetical protein
MDDYRSRRVDTSAAAIPTTPDFQQYKLDCLTLLPAADFASQKLETISKSLFQPFATRTLVNKFAGIGIFSRTLILQTRLLIMLQVEVKTIAYSE